MHVRRLILLVTVALGVCASPAAATPTTIRVLACSPWQEGIGGTVSFQARMRAVRGTARMTLRFDLLEKARPGRYRRISIGEVRKSRRGARVFKWEQKVEGLRQGGSYRGRIVYRWLDSSGRVLQSLVRRSDRCKQPGGLPNLRISGIAIGGGLVPGTAVYKVRVVNRGDSEARRVSILLRVDGDVLDESDAIDVLAPGESRTVRFSGPVCRSEVRAIADPKRTIAESNEQDNIRSASCL